jgi:hypothetical protein
MNRDDHKLYLSKYMNCEEIGFIVTRHVSTELHGKYYKKCYESIRRFYPEVPIVIIDDNSNQSLIDREYDSKMQNTTIVQSEYPKRGELLPYIYFIRNKWFKKAVIIHDSVFINSLIDFSRDNVSLWDAEHTWNNPSKELYLIMKLNNNKSLVKQYHDKTRWRLCFGVMAFVTHDFIVQLNVEHNLINLINFVVNREFRCCLERIMGLLLCKDGIKPSEFGNIHKHSSWGFQFSDDIIEKNPHIPIIKVWSGR